MIILDIFKKFIHSLKYAFDGIMWALDTQRNLKIHFFIAIFVLILSVIFKISRLELIFILTCITLVFFSEMVNSAIEVVIDIYFKDEYSIQARVTKDVAAGAVLVVAIGSVLVGILIFIPKIVELSIRWALI